MTTLLNKSTYMPTEFSDFILIQQPDELAGFCQQLQTCEWIALDTEFIREKTYHPQLCLVQIATPAGKVACIDPLAISDLSPLVAILTNADIGKVLHAGSQDMEIFTSLCKQSLSNVFDTQIAGPLFGYPEQMGYATLVEYRLGTQLSKNQSRTNWAARPLSEKQLRYAADDVIYLARLFPDLHAELVQKERLSWLHDEFEKLCDINTYQKPLHDVWQRIRGIDRLNGQSLAIAQALAEWREVFARQKNLPRNWLLKDDAIIDIARLKPSAVSDLQSLRGLGPNALDKHGQMIVDTCDAAKSQKPRPLPARLRKRKLTPQEDALVDLLSAVAKLRAEEHSINHTVLAPRKELEKLVTGEGESRVLSGWRKQFVGQAMQQLLHGEITLSVDAREKLVRLEKPENRQ